MIELNVGMIIGFVVVLLTMFALSSLVQYLIKKNVPEPKEALKVGGRIVSSIFLVAFVLFFIAMIWTGWRVSPTPHPQGELETTAGELDYTPGENRPKERRERLGQGDDLQREGQQKLQEFRKEFLKKKE